MMTSTVVIGAGFGDEGKGLITDFETRRLQARTVVRFNGGAQAGHTVVDGDRRHVFGHLAAGSFAGASTYLSRHFVFNPILLEKERTRATGLPRTSIGVHAKARVSTMYDMVLNWIAEMARDATGRHGSCGVGINETVTRHAAGFEFFADDFMTSSSVRIAHEMIASDWVPRRLEELLKNVPHRAQIMERFANVLNIPVQKHVDFALECFTGINIHTSRAANKPVVFEGAQGLRLDEFLGEFPHVTRSITGLPYAIIAAEEMGVRKLRPIYVTRCYTTRHGAGPLPFEGQLFYGGHIEPDRTNIPNEWQGELRYAPLDLCTMRHFIMADLDRGRSLAQAHGVELDEPMIAITCLDQVGSTLRVVGTNGAYQFVEAHDLPSMVAADLGISVSHVSYGPAAKDVTCFL